MKKIILIYCMLVWHALSVSCAHAIYFTSQFSANHLWVNESIRKPLNHTFILDGYDPEQMSLMAVSLTALVTNAGENTGEVGEYDRLHIFDASGAWWGTIEDIPHRFFTSSELTLTDHRKLLDLAKSGHTSLSMYGSGTFFLESVTLTAKAKIESNPEPAIMLLIGAALIGLAGMWRWLKRRNG